MSTTTTAPVRDLLISMATDAIMERQPPPARVYCGNCMSLPEGRECSLCAGDRQATRQYRHFLARVEQAGSDAELAPLLTEVAA